MASPKRLPPVGPICTPKNQYPADVDPKNIDRDGKFWKLNHIAFQKQIFSPELLSAHLRMDGTRKFLTCMDILFDSSRPLTIVEVGLCKGKLIKAILNYRSDTRCFCIEPNEVMARRLQEAISGSNIKCSIANIGLGAECGTGTLYITKSPQFSSELKPNSEYKSLQLEGVENTYQDGQLDVERVQKFPIITGDQFFEDNNISSCDVISINTQGTELPILKGLKKTLSAGVIKAVKVEIDFAQRYEFGEDDNQLSSIESLLTSCGFRIFDILLIKQLVPVGVRMLDVLYVHKSIDIPR